jgi:hypothetical protein
MSIKLPNKPVAFRFVGGPCDGRVAALDRERAELPKLPGCPLTESEVHWVLTNGGSLGEVIEELSAVSRRHLYRITMRNETHEKIVLTCHYCGVGMK